MNIDGLNEVSVFGQGDPATVRVTVHLMAAGAQVPDEAGMFKHRNGFLKGHVAGLLRVHDFRQRLVRLAHKERMNNFLCNASGNEQIFIHHKCGTMG